MTKIIVVAPHADDETLGCGGTLLRHINEGDEVHWLLVTDMSKGTNFSDEQIKIRKGEIAQVCSAYNFSELHELNLPPAALDTLPRGNLVAAITGIFTKIQPETVYTVYRNDAHSDHELVYDAVMSATKSFRYPFVKRVLAYETISETDFGMKPEDGGFRPNVFINIENYIEKKLNILECYKSEIGEFPFPRSRIAINALAQVRGAQSNCQAAEAFILIKELL
jgi:N-acetylglucosamine malate deacetylase 1